MPADVTDAKQAAHLLYQDALAQADAEAKAWPYAWFKHPGYVPASGRGTVKGRIVINDAGNPNASAAGTWVGLEQQPQTIKGFYDFQKWLKPYQFWVQADKDGNFTVPNVIAGENYTLWAYGPGAAGTFLSQEQAGGKPPLEYTLPAKPFAVNVTAGQTSDLGTITWTPKRVGATVFELGTPDRKAGEFRHGDDFWSPAPAPKLGYPTPVWGGQVEFPLDFPDGMTYTVGKSRWPIDWNYVLPSAPDRNGAWQPCTGKIVFDLATPPHDGAAASLYLGCAGDDGGHVIVSVNGVNLGSADGVTAAPQPIDASGFNPAYSDDASIHLSNHGPFSDERINFPAKLLHAGQNTITIQMDARKLTAYLMLDYLRLELSGYVPPAPARVTAYAGNNRALVCWPLVPGATSYNLLRSTSRDGQYAPVATGFVAPVCGSGPSVAQYVDTTAANGSEYFYKVQSVNPTGSSEMSPAQRGREAVGRAIRRRAARAGGSQSHRIGSSSGGPRLDRIAGGQLLPRLANDAARGRRRRELSRRPRLARRRHRGGHLHRHLTHRRARLRLRRRSGEPRRRQRPVSIGHGATPAGPAFRRARVARRALEQDPRRAGDHADLVAGRRSDRVRHLPLVRPRAGVHLAGPLPDGPRGDDLRRQGRHGEERPGEGLGPDEGL